MNANEEVRKLVEPPFPAPAHIHIPSVLAGELGSADGGWLSTASGEVSVRIEGDSSSVFAVTGLETFALKVSHELQTGPPVRSWQSVDAAEGSGPIAIRKNEALVVTVGFSCDASSTQSIFDASAVIVSKTGALASLPIEARLASIKGLRASPPLATITFPGSLDSGSAPTFMQFTAVAGVSDGSTRRLDASLVSWTSSAADKADVNAKGVATGAKAGTTFITAAYKPANRPASFTGKAQLNVEP